MFLIIPAVFRHQMLILEARASDRAPAIPDTEFFRWFGNARFKPFPEDLPAVIEAAESHGNSELAAVLKRP